MKPAQSSPQISEDVTKVILNGGDPRFKLVESRNLKNGRRALHECICSRN